MTEAAHLSCFSMFFCEIAKSLHFKQLQIRVIGKSIKLMRTVTFGRLFHKISERLLSQYMEPVNTSLGNKISGFVLTDCTYFYPLETIEFFINIWKNALQINGLVYDRDLRHEKVKVRFFIHCT